MMKAEGGKKARTSFLWPSTFRLPPSAFVSHQPSVVTQSALRLILINSGEPASDTIRLIQLTRLVTGKEKSHAHREAKG